MSYIYSGIYNQIDRMMEQEHTLVSFYCSAYLTNLTEKQCLTNTILRARRGSEDMSQLFRHELSQVVTVFICPTSLVLFAA
jgi:hypothetical protein